MTTTIERRELVRVAGVGGGGLEHAGGIRARGGVGGAGAVGGGGGGKRPAGEGDQATRAAAVVGVGVDDEGPGSVWGRPVPVGAWPCQCPGCRAVVSGAWRMRPGAEAWVLDHARACAAAMGVDLAEACRGSVGGTGVGPTKSQGAVVLRWRVIAEMRRRPHAVGGVPSYPQIAKVLGMAQSAVVVAHQRVRARAQQAAGVRAGGGM